MAPGILTNIQELGLSIESCSIDSSFAGPQVYIGVIMQIYVTFFSILFYYPSRNRFLAGLSFVGYSVLRPANYFLGFAFHAPYLGVYLVIESIFTIYFNFMSLFVEFTHNYRVFNVTVNRGLRFLHNVTALGLVLYNMSECDHPTYWLAVAANVLAIAHVVASMFI